MNKILKVVFATQMIIAALALIHNFLYVHFSMNFLLLLLYSSLAMGAFLTWKVFDKNLTIGMRIASFIIGTIPLICTLIFLLLVSALPH